MRVEAHERGDRAANLVALEELVASDQRVDVGHALAPRAARPDDGAAIDRRVVHGGEARGVGLCEREGAPAPRRGPEAPSPAHPELTRPARPPASYTGPKGWGGTRATGASRTDTTGSGPEGAVRTITGEGS